MLLIYTYSLLSAWALSTRCCLYCACCRRETKSIVEVLDYSATCSRVIHVHTFIRLMESKKQKDRQRDRPTIQFTGLWFDITQNFKFIQHCVLNLPLALLHTSYDKCIAEVSKRSVKIKSWVRPCQLLPDRRLNITYSLRPRRHDLTLSRGSHCILDGNFIVRQLSI